MLTWEPPHSVHAQRGRDRGGEAGGRVRERGGREERGARGLGAGCGLGRGEGDTAVAGVVGVEVESADEAEGAGVESRGAGA